MILPLAGGGTVECRRHDVRTGGRARRFSTARPTWSTSAIDQTYVIAGEGRFAICGAGRTRTRSPTAASRRPTCRSSCAARADCSRQVHNFGTAGVFEADKLIACEVITPGGNWSSYPPHKHDEDTPTRVRARGDLLLRDRRRARTTRRGFGYHRVYGTADRPIEVLEEVRTGDVVLVPHGYHGPSVAAPGYDMYYLNVMAGPGAERAWKIVDDPEHALGPRHLGRPGRRPPTAPARPRRSMTVVSTASEAGREDRRRRGDRATHRRPGHHPVPRQPVRRARRRTQQVLRRLPSASSATATWPASARRCCRPSSTAPSGTEPALPYVLGPQRAGHGAHRRRLRPAEGPAADLGRHRLRRPRLDQHADRRGARDHQPAAGAAAARRHLRHPGQLARCCRSSSCPYVRRRHRQRRVPAAVALLRPGVAARAAARRAARRDAGAHRPGRDRCGDRRLPAGRAGRGPRLAGSLFAERVWHVARPLPERVGDRRRAAEVIRGAPQAADRRRRRRASTPGRPTRSRRSVEATGIPVGADARRARARCPTTTRSPSARSARPAPRRPTRWPPRPTSSSASAPATATSPPPPAPRSTIPDVRFVNINVASIRRRASRRGVASSPTPGRPSRRCGVALGGYSVERRHTAARTADLAKEWDDTVAAAYTASDDGAAACSPRARSSALVNDAVRPARRRGLRRRLDAGRPAQAVAHPRPQGLPRRIRLLLHGLRGRRRHRRPDGRAPTATCSSWSATAPT